MSSQEPKKTRKSKKAEEIPPPVLEPIPEEPEIKPKRRVRKVKNIEPVEQPPEPTPAPAKAPRKQSAWFQALKQWNNGKEKYRIPKRDTPEYAEIQKLMGGLTI